MSLKGASDLFISHCSPPPIVPQVWTFHGPAELDFRGAQFCSDTCFTYVHTFSLPTQRIPLKAFPLPLLIFFNRRTLIQSKITYTDAFWQILEAENIMRKGAFSYREQVTILYSKVFKVKNYRLKKNHHWSLKIGNDVIVNTVKSRYLEVDGTIFYKFKLPEVQINLHFG